MSKQTGYGVGRIRTIQPGFMPFEMRIALEIFTADSNPEWKYCNSPDWAVMSEQQCHPFGEQDKAWYKPYKGL